MKTKTKGLALKVIDRIRDIVGIRNETQKSLAQKLGKTQQAVNKQLNHSKDISINNMERYAEAINVDVKDLLPINLVQHNYEGSKEIAQVENINIGDKELIQKVIENQKTLTDLIQKLILSQNKD